MFFMLLTGKVNITFRFFGELFNNVIHFPPGFLGPRQMLPQNQSKVKLPMRTRKLNFFVRDLIYSEATEIQEDLTRDHFFNLGS